MSDKPDTLGFKVQVMQGTDIYRPHEGAEWPPQSMEAVESIAIDENLITTKDGLVEGEELLVHDLFGLNVAKVAFHSEDGVPYGISPSGNMMYFFKFDESYARDDDPEEPRWVCTGSANLKGLKKLNFDR